MTDDHDAPDDLEAEPSHAWRSFGSPRLARLVRAPGVRRPASRRLIAAVVIGLVALWGFSVAGMKFARSTATWVAGQPEYQIPFGAIELVPPPPPYIKSGAEGLLETVRLEAKHGATISVLGANLDALRVDFSRNPWVESVGPIRASYRHLSVAIVYRQPIALVVTDLLQNQAVAIDRNGVELPSDGAQCDWAERSPRYRAAGMSRPLIVIQNLGTPVPERVGLTWKSADPKIDDDKVIQAARIAEFLADRAESKTPLGRPMPDFTQMHFYDKEVMGFFLKDVNQNWVFWQSAPGHERSRELKATRKWAALGSYIDAKGCLQLDQRRREYLLFTLDMADVRHFGLAGSHRETSRPGSP